MPPRTDWKETIAPDEAARHERNAELLVGRHKGGGRTLHMKAHVGARAELAVLPNLPEPYRVGIFGAPGTFPAWVRYSNGGGGRVADRKPDLRGMAIKLVGVPGRKLIPGLEDAVTQDFLMIHSPTVPFKSTEEFLTVIFGATQPLTLLPKLIWTFGLVRTFTLLRDLARATAKPIASLATQRYWSAAVVRWGDYAAKISAIPVGSGGTALEGPVGTGPDYLAEELTTRLAGGPVVFDLAVQLYTDPVATPIEDPTVEWKESDAPFVVVARLTLPQQDLRTPAGRAVATYIEGLSFDPWHAPVEFRPLGDVMRARNPAYRVSTAARGASPEPDSMVLPPS